jgi:hypothetical protein
MEGCSNFQPSPTPSSLPKNSPHEDVFYLIGREMDGINLGGVRIFQFLATTSWLFVMHVMKQPKSRLHVSPNL